MSTVTTSDVTVVEGTVDITDSLGKYNANGDPDMQESNPSVIVDYMIYNRFIHSKHRYMLGITSPGGFQGDSVAFVQLTNPTTLLIVEWTALKWNSQPQIPDPEIEIAGSANNVYVLLEVRPTLTRVDYNPVDMVTPRYRISGVYVYGSRRPFDNVFQDVQFPIAPWMDPTGLDRTMPASQIVANLIMRQ